MPSIDHTVRFSIERGSITANFTCHAKPGSHCLMSCPMGCDTVPCDHAYVPIDYCLFTTWMDNMDTTGADFYAGHSRGLSNGAIDAWWDGEDWIWAYYKEVSL